MTPEEIFSTLKEAVALHQRCELAAAEAAYERVLRAQPDQGDALHFLGVLMHQRGRNDEALMLIRRAAEILPGHAVVHNNLGNVLQGVGAFDEAIAAYRAAIKADTSDAVAHYNLGIVLSRQLLLDDAVAAYRDAIALNPRDVDTQKNLAQVLRRAGRVTEAGVALRAWLELEPSNPVAAHLLAACTGNDVPERASDAYVAETFDSVAERYDEHLDSLDYRAPELVGKAIMDELEKGAEDRIVLDAGCGTGLAAPHLRPFARRLDGVDLSSGMVARANARGLYDRLEVRELGEYLRQTRSCYDLIASVDTFVYFGSLNVVLGLAASAMRKGGLLVFTVEALDVGPNRDFELGGSGRYRHDAAYVQQVVKAVGLGIRQVKRAVLRKELGEPVAGFVVTAAKA